MKLSELAIRMGQSGMTAPDIANLLEVPVDDIIALGIKREIGRSNFDDVSSAMEEILWLVYEEAKKTLQYGSPAQKNFLMRLVIGYGMRTMAVQTPHALTDLQTEFHNLMESQGAPLPEEIAGDLQDIWSEAEDDEPEDDEDD